MAVIRDDLLKEFGFWSAVLVLKILMMAVLTARQRFSKKVQKVIIIIIIKYKLFSLNIYMILEVTV